MQFGLELLKEKWMEFFVAKQVLLIRPLVYSSTRDTYILIDDEPSSR